MKLRKRIVSALLAAVLIFPQSVHASELINDSSSYTEYETAGTVGVGYETDTVSGKTEEDESGLDTVTDIDESASVDDRDQLSNGTPAVNENRKDKDTAAETDDENLQAIEDLSEAEEIAEAVSEGKKTEISDKAEKNPADDSSEELKDESVTDLSVTEIPKEEEVIGASGPSDDAKLETGVYYLVTNKYHRMVLGSKGNSEAHCANIEIVEKNCTRKQKWVITAIGNGKYKIWNYSSGMALGVAGVTPKNNRNISQYRRNYNNVKEYYIRKARNGCVYIQVVGSQFVLAAETIASTPGANIKLSTYSEQEEAIWLPVPTSTVAPQVGTYIIHSKLDDSKYVSIEGASRYSMAQCILTGSCSAKQMTIYSAAKDKYLIHPACSNYTITACGTVKSGGAVKQFRVTDANRQLWTFYDEGNGYYSIRSAVNSNLVLDITGGKTAEGTPVQLYRYNGRDSQLFSLEKTDGNRIIPNGYYAVKTMLNNRLSLDIANNSRDKGANLQLGNYNDRNRQKFYLFYDQNGYYQIRNVRSGLNLDVTAGSNANGTNVTQYTRNTSKAQKWKPVGSAGVFYFKSALGNVALDVYAGQASAGANIQIYKINNTNAQKFKLVPVSIQTEKEYVVAIDAGHQRHQNTGREPIGPGASTYKQKVSSGTEGRWSGLDEYELNLQVALKLQTELEKRGYSVYMIRTTHDVDISNSERAKMAAQAGADIFIRIHANGADSSSVRGTLNYMPSSSNPYLSPTVIQGSQRLARILLDSYCASTGIPNLGLLTGDDMTGINWATMPVTIVEMGFMSNRTDDLYMASASGQAAIVQGLANGVDQYFAS